MGYSTISEDRPPRVTLHSQAELRVLAADVGGQMPEERFRPGVDELRVALGVGEDETLECWLLVDRSGSVLFDRDELQQVTLAWHFASFDSERDRIGILGFSGFGDYVNLFEFKTPLNRADRAMLLVADCGGGGTPTAEAVTYATRMLQSSRRGAQAGGRGHRRSGKRHHTMRSRSTRGDRRRGAGGRRAETGESPPASGRKRQRIHGGAVRHRLARGRFLHTDPACAARASGEHAGAWPQRATPRLRHPASETHFPGQDDRLIATAADALLALGDKAADEFSERTLDASDPQLRTLAHYLRMRREELHTHGDELLAAALKAAGAR